MRRKRVAILGATGFFRGAQAASLQFAAACRERSAGGAGWQPAYAGKLPALPKTTVRLVL
jgi:hypothetical protein